MNIKEAKLTNRNRHPCVSRERQILELSLPARKNRPIFLKGPPGTLEW